MTRIRCSYGSWGALLAALVVLAGCGTAASGPARGRGGQATATATLQLSWRHVQLPAQVTSQSRALSGFGFAISPVDGRDAWLCVRTRANSPEIWATRDAGETWIDMGALPPVTSEQGKVCVLVADESDPRALAAAVSLQSETGAPRYATLVSTDGGAHWSRIPGDMRLLEMGSQGAITYAVPSDDSAPPSKDIVASTDGLRTWHTVRPAALAADDALFVFWLRPSSTEIVAMSLHDTLWRSTDGGAHWARLSTPPLQTVRLIAWLPARAQWMFCGWPEDLSHIACSTDLGKTWPSRDINPHCYPADELPSGTLLAVCTTGGDGTGTLTRTLYQMPLDATTWMSLGALPDPGIWSVPILYAATATGQLWCVAPNISDFFYVATLPA